MNRIYSVESFIFRGEQIKAWEAKDLEMILGCWHMIVMRLAEEFDGLWQE